MIMASSMNLSLTEELRDFIKSRTGEQSVYATPSEYLRDLIRKDMESQATLKHIIAGLKDVQDGNFSEMSIMDIVEEDQ